jgi:hypothetical protein
MKATLKAYLAGVSFIDETQKANALVNYDRLVKSGVYSHESAYQHIKHGIETITKARHEANASNAGTINGIGVGPNYQAVRDELAPLKDAILFRESPLTKVRKSIKAFNENVSKCNCTLTDSRHSNIPILGPEDYENLRMKDFTKNEIRSSELTTWNSFANEYIRGKESFGYKA